MCRFRENPRTVMFRAGFGQLCSRLSANQKTDWGFGKRKYVTKLQEIGKSEAVKSKDTPYEPGQFFLHKSFFYRGMVLFSWNSRVITDTDERLKQKTSKNTETTTPKTESKRSKKTFQRYYMSLSDPRDSPYKRNKVRAMYFFTPSEKSIMVFVPYTDILNHDDIIPYTNTEENAIHNGSFHRFFEYKKDEEPCFQVLSHWNIIQDHIPWMDMDNAVHRCTTNGVKVTAMPLYIGSKVMSQENIYTWTYCIRIENQGKETFQLRQREWTIFSSVGGSCKSERGQGVEGEEPYLSPEQRCYQYVSFVSLESPRGCMWGSYTMVRQDGTQFVVRIPRMELKYDEQKS